MADINDNRVILLLETILTIMGKNPVQIKSLLSLFLEVCNQRILLTCIMRLTPEERKKFQQHITNQPNGLPAGMSHIKNYYSEQKFQTIIEEITSLEVNKFIKSYFMAATVEQKKAIIEVVEKFFGKSIKQLYREQKKFL